MFSALVSKSDFLKRSPRPSWELRNYSLGATCRSRAGATSKGQN